ncbi:hypothetical protein RHO13_01370 [Orbus wheelerorum]|uniref:hypothetical protein n=1 Tax=Orbus wheelerorum TaxID=3074111 RepID=UPI00370D1CA1
MKKLIIKKFIHNELNESFTVPIAFINILNTILPNSALASLIQHGFDLKQITDASKQNLPYINQANVVEKGIEKKIIIQLS